MCAPPSLPSTLPPHLFEQIVRGLDAAVAVLGARGHVVYANAAFARGAGLSLSEVLGRGGEELGLVFVPERRDPASPLRWRKASGEWAELRRTPLPGGAEEFTLLTEVSAPLPPVGAVPRDADPLTGLRGRDAFDAALAFACASAARADRPLSVLVLDLDSFRQVNDTFGQSAGDAVLREVGAALAELHRASDEAFRLGGDEFALLLPATPAHGAARVAGRVYEALTAAAAHLPLHHLTLRASMGTATFPDDATDPMGLLALADLRMYGQKSERGRRSE